MNEPAADGQQPAPGADPHLTRAVQGWREQAAAATGLGQISAAEARLRDALHCTSHDVESLSRLGVFTPADYIDTTARAVRTAGALGGRAGKRLSAAEQKALWRITKVLNDPAATNLRLEPSEWRTDAPLTKRRVHTDLWPAWSAPAPAEGKPAARNRTSPPSSAPPPLRPQGRQLLQRETPVVLVAPPPHKDPPKAASGGGRVETLSAPASSVRPQATRPYASPPARSEMGDTLGGGPPAPRPPARHDRFRPSTQVDGHAHSIVGRVLREARRSRGHCRQGPDSRAAPAGKRAATGPPATGRQEAEPSTGAMESHPLSGVGS
jgi:hypothetical protein